MIQIIKRQNGKAEQKETLAGDYFQVSYNCDGRLVLRLYGGGDDTLVVLDPIASRRVIRFCQDDLKSLTLKEKTERKLSNILDDLPF